MKADQDRVRTLISQTITMLCKKGLEFETELKVQGLLGITVDNKDIFLIHFNEKYDTVSDTKDVHLHDSVATSTGHDTPQANVSDAGFSCGPARPSFSSDTFPSVKKEEPETEFVSPVMNRMENQPTFTDLHESMSDLFPYPDCPAGGNTSSMISGDEYTGQGFLLQSDTSLPTCLHYGHTGNQGKHVTSGLGVISLDSGDEGDGEYSTDPVGQFGVSFSVADSKSSIQLNSAEKMKIQGIYSPQVFSPADGQEALNQYGESESKSFQNSAGASSSQSWALQPVSRSQLSSGQSLSKIMFPSQPMQFSPEQFGEFSLGVNQSSAMISSRNPGMPPRRSPASHRLMRPVARGRAAILSPLRNMQPNPMMNSSSPGGAMSTLAVSSSSASGSSLLPSSPQLIMRGTPRTRRPRGSTAMQRFFSAGSTTSDVPFAGTSQMMPSSMHGSAARMSRGMSSVRTRSLDGYSYGKQTVTNYICNICNAVYKNHSSLLTHQVKVHGRQKKEGKGRPKMLPAEVYEDEDEDEAEMDDMDDM